MSEYVCQGRGVWIVAQLSTAIGGGCEEGQQGSLALLEGFEVTLFGVGGVGFPAAEEDSDPFECQGSQGGVVSFAAGALEEVERLGPGRLSA